MRLSDTTRADGDVVAAGPPRSTPQRTCIGCRQVRPKAHLLRIVAGPEGSLIVDPAGKLPGRGAYICAQRACAARALKGRPLREALRREVRAISLEALAEAMASALRARAVGYIHLARKAGRAVSGYTQVLRALTHAPVGCLLIAEDVAPQRWQEYTRRCASRGISYRSFLTKAQLGALAGAAERSAIAIQDARLAERLMFCLEGMSRLMAR
jgi:predicted RNA-binding protein YlxR (DUF448 family)